MSEHPDFFAAVGAMSNFDALDVDAMRHIYRVERVGETFYEEVARRIGNDEAAALLLKNAREERGHAERMRRALSLKLGRDWEPSAADVKEPDPEIQKLLRQNGREETLHSQRVEQALAILRRG